MVLTIDHVKDGATFSDDIVTSSTPSYENGRVVASAAEPHFFGVQPTHFILTTYPSGIESSSSNASRLRRA